MTLGDFEDHFRGHISSKIALLLLSVNDVTNS